MSPAAPLYAAALLIDYEDCVMGITHLEANTMPATPTPNRRTNALMREHIALVCWCQETGHLTTRHAGDILSRAGVPMDVACRVLSSRHREPVAWRVGGGLA